MTIALEARDLKKVYPGVVAVDAVFAPHPENSDAGDQCTAQGHEQRDNNLGNAGVTLQHTRRRALQVSLCAGVDDVR